MTFLVLLMAFFIWCLWRWGDRTLFPQLALCYLFSSQINTVLDMIVVNRGMLDFPIRLFREVSNISITFDYVLFPILHCFYYQWSYRFGLRKALGLGVLLTSALTVAELGLERYTALAEYYEWNWMYSFASVLATLLLSRTTVRWWFRESIRSELRA